MLNQTNRKQRNNIIYKNLTSPFPIDLVYTWVDGRDENWLNEFTKANEERNVKFNKKDFLNRFVDIEDMRFSLRSVEKNLPFIRYIFIVTWNEQHPYWLNLSNPRVKIISQSTIFPKSVKLPTFNSKSIDFTLYRIPGLSEHFIYSNDDMYFGQPLQYTDFFTIEGKPIIYSTPSNWSQLQRKFYKFEKIYKKTKNDGFLFMISVYYTVINFKEKFGTVMKYGYSHIPISLTKKICEEAYSNFKGEIDKTISHRFRSQHDFQMQTIMIQYGLYSNQSVAKLKTDDIAIFIVASNDNRRFRRLNRYTKKLPKLLSINIDDMRNRDKIQVFLNVVFNKTSEFELKDKPPNISQEMTRLYSKEKVFNLSDSAQNFYLICQIIKYYFLLLFKRISRHNKIFRNTLRNYTKMHKYA